VCEKVKVTLSLAREAAVGLDRLTSERKRGDYVSALIMAALEENFGLLDPQKLAERLQYLSMLVGKLNFFVLFFLFLHFHDYAHKLIC